MQLDIVLSLFDYTLLEVNQASQAERTGLDLDKDRSLIHVVRTKHYLSREK